MDAMSAHSIGVAIFYLTTDHFLVEAFQPHGENVVSFQIKSGYRWWFIVGCYMSPYNALIIEEVVVAIGMRPWGDALLMVFDFNTNMAAPEG